MTFRLEAFAPGDGWAVVREGETTLWLVQPPYLKSKTIPLTTEGARRLIVQEVLPVDTREFDSWGSLIEALNDDRRKLAQGLDKEHAREAARSIIRRSTRTQAIRHLDALEGELLPRRRFLAAQEVINALCQAPAVRADPELLSRISDLLPRCTPPELVMTGSIEDPRRAWLGGTSETPVGGVHTGIRARRRLLVAVA